MVDMKITASATVSKAYMYAPETPGMQDGLLTTMYDEDVTASASLTGMIPLGQIKIIKTQLFAYEAYEKSWWLCPSDKKMEV